MTLGFGAKTKTLAREIQATRHQATLSVSFTDERVSAGFMGKLGQKTLSLFSNFLYICLLIWLGRRGSREKNLQMNVWKILSVF